PTTRFRCAALPAGQVGDAYAATLEASGGTPPYVWSADGLPSGLNIDQPSGVISGTPTEAGTFPVEFTVTDSRGTSVTETLNLVVREPAPGPAPAEKTTAPAEKTTQETEKSQTSNWSTRPYLPEARIPAGSPPPAPRTAGGLAGTADSATATATTVSSPPR